MSPLPPPIPARSIPWPPTCTRYASWSRAGVKSTLSCLITGSGNLSLFFRRGRVHELASREPQRSMLEAGMRFLATTDTFPVHPFARFVARQWPWPGWSLEQAINRFEETPEGQALFKGLVWGVRGSLRLLYGATDTSKTGILTRRPLKDVPIRCPACGQATLRVEAPAVWSERLHAIRREVLEAKPVFDLDDIDRRQRPPRIDWSRAVIVCMNRQCGHQQQGTLGLGADPRRPATLNELRADPPHMKGPSEPGTL